MSKLVEVERAVYDEMWQSRGDMYGEYSPGVFVLPIFMQCVGDARGTIMDAGCGSGVAGVELAKRGFDVTLVDLTSSGLVDEAKSIRFVYSSLWNDLTRAAFMATGESTFDFAFCVDVLEHVPKQFTMLAVARMLEATRFGLFVCVSTVHDLMGAWVGKPLHQTVESFVWWRDALREIGDVVDARDLHHNASFFVLPR